METARHLLSLLLILLCCYFRSVHPLDNGLARTPPMGWMSWTRFACETNCTLYPKECINERLFMQMADIIADEGYAEAGYQYINIDDCWSEKERDRETEMLVPDKKRFPSGMKQLSQYIHAKGLRFGKFFIFDCVIIIKQQYYYSRTGKKVRN